MNPVVVPQDPSSLVPRRYQEEVFRRACEDNIIAALHTGSGKTFISLLLIKWIASQKVHEGKAIIFLVPRVALAQQQGDYIVKHTPLRVIKMFGALDLDLSDRKAWRQRFRDHDVFVMTAQIFLNIVTHSLWSIDKVSLMVFDECHHARKNHPYNGILREYFQVQPASKRPKIFGMTASPIWDPKNPVKSLKLLEGNMDAKVVGVIENYGELQNHSAKPTEIIKIYPPPPNSFEYPSPSIYTCVKVFDDRLQEISEFSWSNIKVRYHITWHTLGPYCGSFFLYSELLQAMARLKVDSSKTRSFLPEGFSESKHISSDMIAIHEVLEGFEDFFPNDLQDDIPFPVPLSWCTPKVKVLVDILLSHYSVSFQAIIFVEQRQIATCLAKVLPAIPELKDKIRSGHFVGEGVNGEGISSSMGANIGDSLKAFRDGTINTLVATSVAEEGLDFPACDLVVRFDSLQHMVGYIQSRGRARNKTSMFIIMIQENDFAQLARYKALKEGEPQVARVYLTRKDAESGEESDEEELSPEDLRERERYVVPNTGAILNYDNALGLLSRLCALIPTDLYTATPNPVYDGDFAVTLRLPSSLPLSSEHLVYHGPLKRSKKEAKRAVAFLAARHLRELDVLNEYLLPVPSVGLDDFDANEDGLSPGSKVPVNLIVMVRDPWVMGPRLWIHELVMHGRRMAGLVTGTRLSLDYMQCLSTSIEIRTGLPVRFLRENELHQKRAMEEFTKLGIQYRLTGTPIQNALSVFLVPVTDKGQPDFDAIERLLANPRGSSDWASIDKEHYNGVLVTVTLYPGRSYRFRRLRDDITPLSRPAPGSREENYPNYKDYLVQRCLRKFVDPFIPTEGPMVELELLPRTLNGLYDLKHSTMVATVRDGGLFPFACCRWVNLDLDVYQAFEMLPAVCNRLTDIYRSVCLRSQIGLPSIDNNLLVEALTLPSAHAGYSNQRLETLGDAVLGLCTTVHLFNYYPQRHEGQLTSLRRAMVCNRFLSRQALEFGLEQFLTNEVLTTGRWMRTLPEDNDRQISTPVRYVKRKIPKRSLQDCMEAILGASFLSGGIPMALNAGRALGLNLGGAETCYMHVSPINSVLEESSYFSKLENSLGYRFCGTRALLESVTHPSFCVNSGAKSYQRLEFLGDAILSLAVMEHLYTRFEEATSYQLSLLRSKLVCNAALAWVAVNRLELHKILLANSVDLNTAIDQYVPVLEAASAEDVVGMGWRYDPPKALSDVFESVIATVFVDSVYNYEKTATVILLAMEDLLNVLKLSVNEDPVSKLLLWTAGQGCRKVAFEKVSNRQGKQIVKGVIVAVHGKVVVGPITATSRRVARFEASKIALECLMDDKGEKSLKTLCTCKTMTTINCNEEMTEEEEVAKMLEDI